MRSRLGRRLLTLALVASVSLSAGGASAVWHRGQVRIVPVAPKAAHHIVFSPSGDEVAIADDDPFIERYAVATGAPRPTLIAGPHLSAIAYSPAARIVAATSRMGVHIMSLDGGEPWLLVDQTLDNGTSLQSVAFAPSGDTLAAVGGGQSSLWDLVPRRPELRLSMGSGWGQASLAGGKLSIAFGSNLDVWALDGGGVRRTRIGPASSVALARNGEFVAVGVGCDRIEVRSLPLAELTATTGSKVVNYVSQLAVSDDGDAVALADDRTLVVVDTAGHELRRVVLPPTPAERVWGPLAFSPHGDILGAATSVTKGEGELYLVPWRMR